MLKVRRLLIGFCMLTGLYIGALAWVDARSEAYGGLHKVLTALPAVCGASLLSYALRYCRWHWLLGRAGCRTGLFRGFLAYLAGFAFTATPGKVGELVRIRYLNPLGVPPWKVLAAFVYERAFDLPVVLLLASLAISRMDVFIFVSGFVVMFLGGIVLVARNRRWLTWLVAHLRRRRMKRAARTLQTLRDGLVGCRVWLTPTDAMVSFGLGLAAWTLTAASFAYLLSHLDVNLPLPAAMATYPLALLAGAASMLPGGVGSTEVTIVGLLALYRVPLGVATSAAAGIRIATLWFAVACGLLSIGMLEFLERRTSRTPRFAGEAFIGVSEPSLPHR